MQQWQSWALSVVGVIGIYLTGRKNWRGSLMKLKDRLGGYWFIVSRYS